MLPSVGVSKWFPPLLKIVVSALSLVFGEDAIWGWAMNFFSRWLWFPKRAVTFAALMYEERIKAALASSTPTTLLFFLKRLYPDLAQYAITMPELDRNGTHIEKHREPVHRQCLEVLAKIAETRESVSVEQWNAALELVEQGNVKELLEEMYPLLRRGQTRTE